MPFKTDNQRKAFFAMRDNTRSSSTPKLITKIRISGFKSNVNVLKKRLKQNEMKRKFLAKQLKKQKLKLSDEQGR